MRIKSKKNRSIRLVITNYLSTSSSIKSIRCHMNVENEEHSRIVQKSTPAARKDRLVISRGRLHRRVNYNVTDRERKLNRGYNRC